MGGDGLLDVSELRVTFTQRHGLPITAVDGVSFGLRRGERLGIVGESGSGKSVTALALTGLVRNQGGRLDSKSKIILQGQDVCRMSRRELASIRGRKVAMIFQDPQQSFNPVYSIGDQVIEGLKRNDGSLRRADVRKSAVELLNMVKLPRPEHILRAYPHELSGGMRQRAMIALALAQDPSLLIADEPTTALDVTIQAQILDLLFELSETKDLAVILITHDFGIVAGFTERCLVMYDGRIVEEAKTDALFDRPRHPYTSALLESIPPVQVARRRLVAIPGSPPEPHRRPHGCAFHPRCGYRQDECERLTPELLPISLSLEETEKRASACHFRNELDLRFQIANAQQGEGLSTERAPASRLVEWQNVTKQYVEFGSRGHEAPLALANVSLDLFEGEALGLVGESGSGKTTLARCLLRFVTPSSGEIRFRGQNVAALSNRKLRQLRSEVQMIFQDPAASLDPRFSVRELLSEPLRIHGVWKKPGNDHRRLLELLDLVQLSHSTLDRYPHQFSGGQRQRIAIARALALRPNLLVCDEPASALDVSVRASILNLLADLRDELSLTLLFITHDLSLVRFLCTRVAVMYRGQVVELAEADQLFADPAHAHTRDLLEAQPEPNPTRERQRRATRRQRRGED
jgi:peptide/nickel transport system ATP-binding protein